MPHLTFPSISRQFDFGRAPLEIPGVEHTASQKQNFDVGVYLPDSPAECLANTRTRNISFLSTSDKPTLSVLTLPTRA